MLIKTFPHVHKQTGYKEVLCQSRRAVDVHRAGCPANKTSSVPVSSSLNKLLFKRFHPTALSLAASEERVFSL